MFSNPTVGAASRGDSAAPRPQFSVLVPVFNNASTLDELIDRLRAVLGAMDRSFEIVFVDDGSRDASPEILQRRAKQHPEIRVLTLAENFGGQAASCAACDYASGYQIIHIDADLENLPEDIPLLIEQLDRGFDFVLGYRRSRNDPWLTRKLPSLLMNAFVRHRTGTRIRDVGCGLCALDARLVEDLESEGDARRLLKPLILGRARHITEVAIRHRPKTERGGHAFLSLLGIATDYYLYTAKRPFLVTGLVASGATIAGTLMLALTHASAVAGVVVASGLLGIMASLLGEYLQRTYHLAQGIKFYQLRQDEVEVASEGTH